MHRWSPLNERQLALLGLLASGKESEAWDPGEFRTAYALRDRGLVTIKRSGGEVDAQVTEAGTFYVQHGHHPDDPAHTKERKAAKGKEAGSTRSASYADRPVALARRTKAKKLIERLVTDSRVTVTKPDDATVTEWRRVIDYAKRHSLIPAGKRIESLRMLNRDLQISLVEGPHPNSLRQGPNKAPPVHVPTQLRSPHPVVAALRDDEGRLVMPAPLRRRSLLLLQGLAAEAVRRGHKVKEHEVPSRRRSHAYTHYGRHYPSSDSLREGELGLVVNSFTYTVKIQQESPQSTDPERTRLQPIQQAVPLGRSQALGAGGHPGSRSPGDRDPRCRGRAAEGGRGAGQGQSRGPMAGGHGEGKGAGRAGTVRRGTPCASRPVAGSGEPERLLQRPGASAGRGGRGR